MKDDDQKLADAVVALDLGPAHWNASTLDMYRVGGKDDVPLTAHEFVRDWRVAGVIMEANVEFDESEDGDSFPRAILVEVMKTLPTGNSDHG